MNSVFSGVRRVMRQAAPALLLLGVLLPGATASAKPALLEVEAGTHQLIRESGGVQRVAIGEPSIADVNVINGREILVSGRKIGLTSLLVWPRGASQPREYRVRVVAVRDPSRPPSLDPELAQARIETGTSLEGRLPNLLAHRRARLAATPPAEGKPADRSEVLEDTQVMTEIRIAEVSRSIDQQFGFNLFRAAGNTVGGIGSPGAVGSVSADPATRAITLTGSSGFVPLQNAFNLVYGQRSNGLLGVLSLLEGRGLARVLAEPSLTAQSGQTASFLAGGEFPVPISQGTSGSVTVQYKEFGVRLSLTPTVLSRNRISLKVAPEVSDLDFSTGIQIGGVAVPSLTVRRTDTTVELGDGETFVISGLVSRTLLANVNKVPWLGNIPILGAFFRSTSNARDEKELIMVVTPRLVRPLARQARLPELPGANYDDYSPGFSQLFFEEQGAFNEAQFGFSR